MMVIKQKDRFVRHRSERKKRERYLPASINGNDNENDVNVDPSLSVLSAAASTWT